MPAETGAASAAVLLGGIGILGTRRWSIQAEDAVRSATRRGGPRELHLPCVGPRGYTLAPMWDRE